MSAIFIYRQRLNSDFCAHCAFNNQEFEDVSSGLVVLYLAFCVQPVL